MPNRLFSDQDNHTDLRQMLVKECDAIPQQCVTKLVTSMRRCQAIVECMVLPRATEAPVCSMNC